MSNAAPVPTLIFEETSNRGPTPFHPLNFSPAEYLRPHKTTATVTKNIIIISPILLSSPCSTPIVLNVNPTAYQPTKTSQQASLMEETHSNLSYLSSNDNHIAVVPNAHLILRIAAASIADTVPPTSRISPRLPIFAESPLIRQKQQPLPGPPQHQTIGLLTQTPLLSPWVSPQEGFKATSTQSGTFALHSLQHHKLPLPHQSPTSFAPPSHGHTTTSKPAGSLTAAVITTSLTTTSLLDETQNFSQLTPHSAASIAAASLASRISLKPSASPTGSLLTSPPPQPFALLSHTQLLSFLATQGFSATLSTSPLSARPPPSPITWDNACSFHITNDITLFSRLYPLPFPIPIGGVGGSSIATHAGYLNCLPSLNYINFALYCPSAPQTLLSLGHLHGCGGSFNTTADPNLLFVYANATILLDTAALLSNNLYSTSLPRLLAGLNHPHLHTVPTSPPPLGLFPSTFKRFITSHPPVVQQSSLPPPARPLVACLSHISNAQYSRALLAHELHCAQAHPPDTKLCHELATGKHPYSSLVPADIILMRRLLGPCPHCLEGRSYKPSASRPPSLTPPTTHPGQTISFDPQKLPCPVLGGFTHKVLMVDEHTGHISQPGLPSKSNASLFNGMRLSLMKTFNSNGHKVDTVHGDAERVNVSLTPHFGSIGTQLKVSLPGHHAHRAERSTQTVHTRARSVAASLPYHLPPELTLLLHQSVGETLNNSICKASAPLTPNEAVSGFKPLRAPIPFGRSALVLQPIDKRLSIAKTSGSPVTLIPVTELGVSMGLQPGTDRTQWLLSNGIVVPRTAIGPLLPTSFIPFNWRHKPTIPFLPMTTITPSSNTMITDPNFPADEHTVQPYSPLPGRSQDQCTLTLTTATPNHPIQLPASSIPDALQLLHPAKPRKLTLRSFTPPSPTISPTNNTTISSIRSPLPITAPIILPSLHPSSSSFLPTTDAAPPVIPNLTEHHPTSDPPPAATITSPTVSSLPQLPSLPPPAPLPQPILPAPSTTSMRLTRSSTLGRALPEGHWGNAFLSQPTGHQRRKLLILRSASLRDRLHRAHYPTSPTLTNRSTEIRPIPPLRQQNEFTLSKALLVLNPIKVHAALDKETDKIFSKYVSLKRIPPSDVEPSAVFVRSKLILREKTNGDVTARIALDGSQQPPHTYGDTHAGTSDAPHRNFVLASSLADATHRSVPLITFDFDVPAAFLNKNPLTREHTGGTQLCTRMPSNLTPPLNNALCEVVGAHYGLKQSNHIYDQDFIQLMLNDGFLSTPSHPYTFVKFSPTSPLDKIIVSMHVDDGDGNTTLPSLYDDFKRLIINRYGAVEFHSPSKGTCGQVQVVNLDNSITLHHGPYILKMLTRIGMDLVPAALSPDIPGLFDPSTDTTPLSHRAAAAFRTVNGELIHILPLRHDIRKVVTHLLTLSDSPDNGAYLKQLHLLRYLKSSPNLGPTFSASPSDYPNGVELHSASDCAHNVHPNGQSHGAFLLTVGRVGATTAPFLFYSAAEKGVSLSPTEGEYVTLSKTAKSLIHFRQFAEDLGYPQPHPSIMLEDNASAIKLTTAPLIPSKSRHIALKHHHVRWACKTKQIRPQHQGSADIVPDAATKHVGPSRFLYFRHQVFQPSPTSPYTL